MLSHAAAGREAAGSDHYNVSVRERHADFSANELFLDPSMKNC